MIPESENASILLDAFNKSSQVKIIPEERRIVGYCRNNSGGVPENFHNYFVAVFDKDFEVVNTWKDNKILKETTVKGDHVGAVVRFKTQKGEQVEVKVASSFISLKQAELNLKREVGTSNFVATKDKAKQLWNKELKRIEVKGGTMEQKRTFYSCLYRVLLFPRKFYEIDENDKITKLCITVRTMERCYRAICSRITDFGTLLEPYSHFSR